MIVAALPRTVTVISLVGATLLTVACPCARVNGCHKREFAALMSTAALSFAYDNYMYVS